MMEIPRILYSSPFMGNYFCEIAHYNMAFVAIAKNAVTYLKSLAIYAKTGTVVSDKEDDCIVVELPDDYGVRDIFNIVSSTEISVSAISDPTVAQFYMIGKLEDGGSVVWRSKEEQTFVYTEKEVKGVEVSHYGNELRDKTPISLEEFDEICESKEG